MKRKTKYEIMLVFLDKANEKLTIEAYIPTFGKYGQMQT